MLRRRGQSGGAGRRALSAGVCLALAAAFMSGCAGTVASPAVDAFVPAGPQARPVADLSGAQLDLANFFMGFGLGHLNPRDSSLDSDFVYDFSIAFDAPPLFSFEFLVGLWSLKDRPDLADGATADSDLDMIPVLFALQLQKEYPKFRTYLAPGVGYCFNDYALGAGHRAAMESKYGVASYSAKAEDSLVYQLGAGVEFYSSESADLNFGMEVRYVMSDMDVTERPGGLVSERTVDLRMLLIRGMVTWHF
jgi:hypothetical protein